MFSDMQVAVRELKDYDTRTIDNPLELLTDVEKLMHVPRKAVYPTLALLETISSLLSLRQESEEGLMSYLERFKSERNVVIGLFGKKLLDGHVENMPAYADLNSIADAADRSRQQQTMKDESLKKFFGLMFLKQSDQSKYGHLLKEFRQSYTNKQRDVYPEDLTCMFDVMRTVEVKKAKPKSAPKNVEKDEDIVQPGAGSFAQTGATKKSEDKEAQKEAHCYACGEPGGYVTDCKLRKNIVEKDWFKNTGKEHYKIDGSVHTQIVKSIKIAAATKKVVKKVGFCGAQVVEVQSGITLDSGSAISLFKDNGDIRFDSDGFGCNGTVHVSEVEGFTKKEVEQLVQQIFGSAEHNDNVASADVRMMKYDKTADLNSEGVVLSGIEVLNSEGVVLSDIVVLNSEGVVLSDPENEECVNTYSPEDDCYIVREPVGEPSAEVRIDKYINEPIAEVRIDKYDTLSSKVPFEEVWEEPIVALDNVPNEDLALATPIMVNVFGNKKTDTNNSFPDVIGSEDPEVKEYKETLQQQFYEAWFAGVGVKYDKYHREYKIYKPISMINGTACANNQPCALKLGQHRLIVEIGNRYREASHSWEANTTRKSKFRYNVADVAAQYLCNANPNYGAEVRKMKYVKEYRGRRPVGFSADVRINTYANTSVTSALGGSFPDQVMYMAALSEFQQSKDKCNDSSSLHHGKGIAYLIGSLEGTEVCGSQAIKANDSAGVRGHKYATAIRANDSADVRGRKYMSGPMDADGSADVRIYKYGNTSPRSEGALMSNFGTCNENAYSHVKEKDAVLAKDGNNIPFDRSDELLRTPLMQAIFRYAIKCESLEACNQSKDLAASDVFAMCVLPAICGGEWKSIFDSMFHGRWRRLIVVCSINVFLTCAKIFVPSDDVSLIGLDTWYSEKGISRRFRNLERSWCRWRRLIVVLSLRLQQWMTPSVSIAAGLRCRTVENDFVLRFVHEMEGARSSARPPGQPELRKLGKMFFLPKNRSTYVEMW